MGNHPSVVYSLHPGLQKIVFENWKNLTPIQEAAFPIIYSGCDCVIEAPTAGGKTEAVFFPLLTRAAEAKKESVQILYLAPLRALLNDIETRVKKYSQACGLHCFKWHGDVSQYAKIKEFQTPSQIFLTTPESIEAIMLRRADWTRFFNDLEVIIIDEAHNFASGDRGSHLISLLERFDYFLKFKKELPQRIAITATIGNPEMMLKWLAGKKRKTGERIRVNSSEKKEKDFEIFYHPNNSDSKESELSDLKNYSEIYKILPGKKTLIFSNSRTNTEIIASSINKFNVKSNTKNPVIVRTHHSAVSKYYREEAENRIKIRSSLRDGLDAIISTSTLELGIDIGELDQVIQAGILTSSSAFLQRVGRTGRRQGKAQFFRGFCVQEEELILLIAVVNLGLKGISDNIKFPTRAYQILAHQIICLSLQCNGINKDRIWESLSGAYCFSGTSLDKVSALINFMIENRFLRDIDGLLVVGEECEKHFLGANWKKLFAVFESSHMYDVFDGKKHIGTLDSAFVEALDIPFLFILGGIEWEAVQIKTKSKEVIARKTFTGNAPKWVVFCGQQIPYETAMEAGSIIFENKSTPKLNIEASECLSTLRTKLSYINWNSKIWAVYFHSTKCEIWSFAGDRINKTLAKLFGLSGLWNATSNYKKITLRQNDKSISIGVGNVLEFLDKIKNANGHYFEMLNNYVENEVYHINSSKFARLLPEYLSGETSAEMIYDLEGLICELKSKKIILIN